MTVAIVPHSERRAGVIYADGKPYYTLTEGDKLWLARMLRGEGPDWDAQLWTIAQRFVLRAKRYERTITELVLSFSEPVNPERTRTGSACGPGGTHVNTEACSPARLDRRDMYRALTREELRSELQRIEEWAQGRIPNPVPRSVNWHATRLAPGNTRIGNYPNVFQATPASMRWPDNKVEVGGPKPGGSSVFKVILGTLLFVGGGGLVVTMLRRAT